MLLCPGTTHWHHAECRCRMQNAESGPMDTTGSSSCLNKKEFISGEFLSQQTGSRRPELQFYSRPNAVLRRCIIHFMPLLHAYPSSSNPAFGLGAKNPDGRCHWFETHLSVHLLSAGTQTGCNSARPRNAVLRRCIIHFMPPLHIRIPSVVASAQTVWVDARDRR